MDGLPISWQRQSATFRLSGYLIAIVLLVIAAGSSRAGDRPAPSDSVRAAVLMEVDGAIGPAITHFIRRGIREAEERDATLLIIQLDTPGGLDSATRDIVKDILGSPVPIAIYVAPSGARAASAGTYMLYAGHVAAMAPGTNLGAATPVQMGGAPGGLPDAEEPEPDDREERDRPPTRDALERKIVEDAAAFMRGLAELRGRNKEWAEKAVREAASLTSEEALELGVIEILTPNLNDLLEQADGMAVNVREQAVTLRTAGAEIDRIEPGWQTELLSTLTNPNIVFILMMLGIYGLLYEFLNPGSIYPGVIGAICLILALFALNMLPLNYAGLALVALGIIFMISEAFTPTFGALGLGGVVAFAIGAVMLFDTDLPEYRVDLPVIIAVTAVSAAVFIFVVGSVWKAYHRPVVAGREELVGAEGHVLAWDAGQGRIRLHGELWRAESSRPIKPNTRVRVTGAEGLTLHVEPVNDDAADAPTDQPESADHHEEQSRDNRPTT